MENSEEKIMTRKQTQLLVTERLAFENEFQSGKTKKTLLWNQVLEKILEKDPSFSFSKNDMIVKYTNCYTTYKRIKKRYRETGKGSTTWEFFDEFDEVFGRTVSADPFSENLFLSMDEISNDNESNLNIVSTVKTENYNIYENDYGDTETPSPIKRESRPRKRKFKDIIDALKDEVIQADRHHKDLLIIEKEKIKILRGIKDLMEKFLH
ncbi:uncharacterized protein LOC129606863 [Condylostylus longicornis]|uniref:uncharacterized protein LOC129606863 n=1 Tax=Condylostylus longicornis TaxID=2530218 RepID=UPI00244DAEA1|nr:uncharacterized protein LOC129606863 [Condylostylus longicornis]